MDNLKDKFTEEELKEIHCCGCKSNTITNCKCEAYIICFNANYSLGHIKQNPVEKAKEIIERIENEGTYTKKDVTMMVESFKDALDEIEKLREKDNG